MWPIDPLPPTSRRYPVINFALLVIWLAAYQFYATACLILGLSGLNFVLSISFIFSYLHMEAMTPNALFLAVVTCWLVICSIIFKTWWGLAIHIVAQSIMYIFKSIDANTLKKIS